MSAGKQLVQRRCSVVIILSFRFFLVLLLDNRMPLTSIEKHQHIEHWLKFFPNFQTKCHKKIFMQCKPPIYLDLDQNRAN